jgi:2-oxoglutarate ferredoxin oxidoreductase subunit beta
MADLESLGKFETAWCPGCGDFGILDALKDALVKLDQDMHKTVFVSGIGQAAKLPQYLNCNFFNGLHGRAIPVATGIKIANKDLCVIVTSGDGDIYGEGGNHFLAAIRRNIDITVIVHDNQVYGLTKGQASPTSDPGFVTKVQTHGVINEPFHPLAGAIAFGAGFVARSFSGDQEHLSQMIREGVTYKGFSLIDVLQPCITFNKKNNFVWYKQRVYRLPQDYDSHDKVKAYEKAMEWGDKIPIGVLYRDGRPTYEEACGLMKDKALIAQDVSSPDRIRPIFKEFL